MQPLTMFGAHVEAYKAGCGSAMCASAGRRVIAKGKLPCDILFIGEAPGESEDVLGKPFVGPAGKLLDRIIARAGVPPEVRLAFTNMVCCLPRDEEGNKVHEPDSAQIKSCSNRLVEFVRIANPKIIITVGKVPETWLTPPKTKGNGKNFVKLDKDYPLRPMIHPAAILRANVAQQSLLIKRSVIVLTNAILEL